MHRPFRQIDVFGRSPYSGNPVAVVLDADGVSTADLRRFSVWTNLSECTFLLPPTTPAADYRVRIFSLSEELPFAGHPTLGSARAWLDAGGIPTQHDVVVQECGVGLVPVRVDGEVLSFRAPERSRSGALDPADLSTVLGVLGVDRSDVVDASWADNGPGWAAVLLRDAASVRAVRPEIGAATGAWSIGVIGPTDAADDARFEVRAFFTDGEGPLREDPVTGSLNASLAQWMLETGRATAPYAVRQGTVVGRDGRISISADADGVWVGGRTRVAISGTAALA